jgi:hypothetical protein
VASSQYADLIPGSTLLWQAGVSLLSFLTIAGVFYVLFRYAPMRRVEFRDVLPAALVAALLWEVTRRLLAFYLERSNMISGYGPIGAALALLFWLYVASMIILVGAQLSYAVAKERRGLRPDEQLRVIAPPGEQPTPKFAPQVGQGTDVGDDEPHDSADPDDVAGAPPEAGDDVRPAPVERSAAVPPAVWAPAPEIPSAPSAREPDREPDRDKSGLVALGLSAVLTAGSVVLARLRHPRP